MLSVRSKPRTEIPFIIWLDILAVFLQMIEPSAVETKIGEFFITKDDTTRVSFDVDIGPSHVGLVDVHFCPDADASSNCRSSGFAPDLKDLPKEGPYYFPHISIHSTNLQPVHLDLDRSRCEVEVYRAFIAPDSRRISDPL